MRTLISCPALERNVSYSTIVSRIIHRFCLSIAFTLTALSMMYSTSASAYQLYKTGSCDTGLQWSTSSPIKVRLLADSYFDFLDKRKAPSSLKDLARIDSDIRAVIALYNSIPGNSLTLELDTGIGGDNNLQDPAVDNFGTQTIVIGFTDEVFGDSAAEAWAPGSANDACIRTRAHILFRKDVDWVFGPPDSLKVDTRHFNTVEQPVSEYPLPHTFLGILTHEMGHAVGLSHPDNDYAIMAQAFKTWFRGPDNTIRSGLLPDDIAGVIALYGNTETRQHVDVSVTNTWFKSAESQFKGCTSQIGKVDAAAVEVSKATGLPVDGQFPADAIFKGKFADLFNALENAQNDLQDCEAAKNARQVYNCTVSSRVDEWTDKLSGMALCGTNLKNKSNYAPVSTSVCPGKQIQLRYALNNNAMYRDVLVKTEVWFSEDEKLNALDGSDHASPDVREFTIKAGASALLGHVFRLPANVPSGKTLQVFARAIPYDTVTGEKLWNNDVDKWNNAILIRNSIRADSNSCS